MIKMSKKDENQEENLTKSQAKRAARKKEIESAKKKAIAGKITGVIIAVAAVAFIGWIIGLMVVKGMNKVSPLEDHSAIQETLKQLYTFRNTGFP